MKMNLRQKKPYDDHSLKRESRYDRKFMGFN